MIEFLDQVWGVLTITGYIGGAVALLLGILGIIVWIIVSVADISFFKKKRKERRIKKEAKYYGISVEEYELELGTSRSGRQPGHFQIGDDKFTVG